MTRSVVEARPALLCLYVCVYRCINTPDGADERMLRCCVCKTRAVLCVRGELVLGKKGGD